MGIHYEFGPPAEGLDPRRAGGVHPWRGERRLSKAQLAELVRVVEAEGWWVEGRSEFTVGGRGDEDIDCEELSFGAAGGWLSKPSSDDGEAETQMDLVYTICDYAGWVVHDPQSNEILYGVAMRCPQCGHEFTSRESTCPMGHPVAEAKVVLTVSPPDEIPDEEATPPEETGTMQFRNFRHSDGRQWSVRAVGRQVELIIVLPDGERIERTRSALDARAALVDVEERIESQLGNGFEEIV